jgi:hypothetical protein
MRPAEPGTEVSALKFSRFYRSLEKLISDNGIDK